MALEMGCKSDSIVNVATELLAFLSGVSPVAANSPAEEKSEEMIAACGTALAASEAADLVAQAEPAGAADAPAAAAISRETLLELPTTSEVPAAQEISVAAATEVAVEPVPAETTVGTTVGVLCGQLAPTSEQSRTEPALAAEASKVADDEHTSTQANRGGSGGQRSCSRRGRGAGCGGRMTPRRGGAVPNWSALRPVREPLAPRVDRPMPLP
jgi:hypothetical protein